MVKIKVVGSLTIGDKTFSIRDSEGTIYTKGLGVPDNFYGGYVKEFRATKYGVYLCMNKTGEVVNLAYTDESLTDEGKMLLKTDFLKQVFPTMEPISEPVFNTMVESEKLKETLEMVQGKPVAQVSTHTTTGFDVETIVDKPEPVKSVKEVIKKESVVSTKNNHPKGTHR